ncbi:MAG: hypothetical protein CALGDGBN_02319 [Pseudomonadales bacterium]|nr:hypothetical protein [Pseudomonadales bacterium]
MKKSIVAAGALALAATLGSAGASANLVQNGSFENPVQASGTWSTYNAIQGWTSTYGIEVRNDVVGSAFDGDNFVELDTNRNSSMRQRITTVANTAYTLTFAYSPREAVAAGSNTIRVLWNGVALATLTASGIGNTGNVWTQHQFTVNGTGRTGGDVLRFTALGTSDSLGGGLDGISLTAVPLPPAAILFGSVIFGFAVVARRRGAAAAAA